jgi:hypothetical protein
MADLQACASAPEKRKIAKHRNKNIQPAKTTKRTLAWLQQITNLNEESAAVAVTSSDQLVHLRMVN